MILLQVFHLEMRKYFKNIMFCLDKRLSDRAHKYYEYHISSCETDLPALKDQKKRGAVTVCFPFFIGGWVTVNFQKIQ